MPDFKLHLDTHMTKQIVAPDLEFVISHKMKWDHGEKKICTETKTNKFAFFLIGVSLFFWSLLELSRLLLFRILVSLRPSLRFKLLIHFKQQFKNIREMECGIHNFQKAMNIFFGNYESCTIYVLRYFSCSLK